jgi:hypothetical protein
MPENDILRPNRFQSPAIGSIATNGSAAFIFGPMTFPGQVTGAWFQNGTTSSATSGTTTGSSASVVLYKNASSAGSIIATFNGSGTAVATLATAALVTSGTAGSTNSQFAAGDKFIAQVLGGAANNGSQADAVIAIDYVYGYMTGTTPAAGTGPA